MKIERKFLKGPPPWPPPVLKNQAPPCWKKVGPPPLGFWSSPTLIKTQAIQSKFICSILPNIGRISRPDCKGVLRAKCEGNRSVHPTSVCLFDDWCIFCLGVVSILPTVFAFSFCYTIRFLKGGMQSRIYCNGHFMPLKIYERLSFFKRLQSAQWTNIFFRRKRWKWFFEKREHIIFPF